MFGEFLSSCIKVATLPVDAANSAVDMVTGGDGSKASRTDDNNPVALAEKLRDNVADAAKAIDKK